MIKKYFPETTPYEKPSKPIEWIAEPKDEWSGIIIYVPDKLPLKGTNTETRVIPAINARIINKKTEVIFDPAVKHNWLAYYELKDEEKSYDIAGYRPLKIMARELYGINACDIVIGGEDSKRILASPSAQKALSSGKIVLLLEKPPNFKPSSG